MNGFDLCVSLFLGGVSGALLLSAVELFRDNGSENKIFSYRSEKRLENTLPEVLERIAGGLSAGFSLQQSLETVSRVKRNPSAELFLFIMSQVKTGQPLDRVLEETANKFSRRSLPLALHTMAQTQRSGANLVESLNLLALISRDRESVRKKIATMSAQGRLQGVILCLVPVLFMAGLFIASPQSLFPVIKSSLGKNILFLALILQATGGTVIVKMVNKEIF